MLEHISINDLKPGMYVQQVIEQKGTLRVKTQGYVRSQKTVSSLKQSGIVRVAIDPSKTLNADKKPQEPQETPPTVNPNDYDPRQKTASLESELVKAKILYTEALNLQQKMLDDIQADRAIDPEPVDTLSKSFMDSIFRNQDALACMTRIREKDSYLLEHSVNVSILITILAKHLKLEKEIIHQLATGALLHDIGKIRIPDAVLHKPGRLTEEEFQVMRSHVVHSADILQSAPDISDISYDVAANHHERLDGNGYPNQLQGNQISIYARMIAIVDAYDAMTAHRCYKAGLNPLVAFKILKKDSNIHFDPKLVDKFINAIGVHPAGSMVKLSSGKLGIITESNFESPLQPVVKTFYHTKLKQFTEIKRVNLADRRVNDEIESNVNPEDYRIDVVKLFKSSIH